MDTNTIEIQQVDKSFGAVHALVNVSLAIKTASIHALVGENGAGKSTLGKLVGGLLRPDKGLLIRDGKPVHYFSPREALEDGIATIQQEVSLIPKLSVISNVLLGIEDNRFGILREDVIRRRFKDYNRRFGFELPPDVRVSDLRIADQKKVELLRAIARDAELIVLDEPTAVLDIGDAKRILDIVRNLNREGKTIIYISHFLSEVLELADTVTVLRNGEVIRTSPVQNETPSTLVEAMLGHSISLSFPPKVTPRKDTPLVCSVEGLTVKGVIEDVSFDVREGEILGFAGLVGSGRSETARAIFGADKVDSGTVKIRGRIVNIKSPFDAVGLGIAMLPEKRKLQGLVMKLRSAENITLPHIKFVSRGPSILFRKEQDEVRDLLERLEVKPPRPDMRTSNFSGGNQQKILFGKWLFRAPVLFIADEPTQGVDVGAKVAIYGLINSLARNGMAVILISSEVEEILGLATRVLVLRQGKIAASLEGEMITDNAIMHAAFAA